MTERFKFVVYRDTWMRGDPHNAELLNHEGKRCCLGFLGQACGLTDSDMLGRSAPAETKDKRWPAFLLTERRINSEEGNELMCVNDDKSMDDSARERRVTELFAAQGIDVTFIDGPGEQP